MEVQGALISQKKDINNASGIIQLKKGYDGYSGGDTPGPIPNPEVKSTSVPFCTMVREPMGIWDRRQPLLLFINNVNYPICVSK